jgi:hypothetical protein
VTRACNPARLLATLAVAAVLAAGCSGGKSSPAASATTAAESSTPPATHTITPESLPSLGVSADDLPQGFSVRREGYVEAGEPIVAVYRRAFDPGQATLGSSVLADLVSDVALFPSSEQADRALGQIVESLTGARVEQTFASILRAYTGIEATDLNGQTLVSPVVGDGAVAARAFFDSPVGRAEALLFVVRVGPLHLNVFLVGERGKVELEDGARVTAKATERLQAAVAATEPEA